MSQQLTPLGVYQRDLEKAEFFADSSQQQAVEKLQRLYDHLLADRSQQNTFFRRITLLFRKQRTPVTGIYFWGGVGRGKTWLVDTFYDCLPFKNKQRIHFHRFMRDVHAELKQLRDKTDPLDIIAQNWARRVQVLCFDEFVVNDVADAVILARLARGLFARGVTIVATSNVEPKNLYLGGLQRALFLPTIDLIYQYTEVFNLDGGRDYRLEFLDRAETYLFPCNQEALADLQYNFARLAPDEDGRNTEIVVNGRPIKTVRVADGIVWTSITV